MTTDLSWQYINFLNEKKCVIIEKNLAAVTTCL